MKDDLQKKVAQFAEQLFFVAFVDGFDDFVGFFEHHRLEAFVSLLTIPRTAPGRSQSSYQLDQRSEFFAGDCFGYFGHGPNLQDEQAKSKDGVRVRSPWSVVRRSAVHAHPLSRPVEFRDPVLLAVTVTIEPRTNDHGPRTTD